MSAKRIHNYYIPPYMGRTYSDIIRWCNTFFQEAPPYLASLNISAMDFDVAKGGFETFRTLFTCRNNINNYSKELTQELHDLMFLSGKTVTTVITVPGLTPDTAYNGLGGFIVRINDWWVHNIQTSSAYTVEIGKLLGFIHDPKPQPAPGSLVAESRVTCDGAKVNIFTIIPAPADAQSIHVDKHDGNGMTFVNIVNHSHYDYSGGEGGLPAEEKLWTFKIALRVKDQDIGTAAYINVPVKKV